MIVTLSRIIKYGFQTFFRNGWLSVSTISIMILAAIVFEGLILFNVTGKTAINSIQEKIDISVYFKSNVPEDSILSIKRSLEKLDEVASVIYVSRDQALQDFKKRHENDEAISQAVEELDENPLLAAINIKAKDPREYKAIASYLDNKTLQDQIEKVSYAQNEVVIDRLVGLIDTLRNGGIVLTIFLAFLAIVVTFNTIRLAIFSSNDQIGIMRLVGASNTFVRGPFIVEGILYGVVSAIVSFVFLIPIISFLSPYVNSFIPEMNLSLYVSGNVLSLLLYQFLFCIGLGIFSSIIAVRKYLHI
ncbi:ABC transporter permease [Candidatus Parcubacteria bacterium]|jgi:cell division transport system permease protein|nr:MAG: ABC transporter permease [Candidatus Parcubacteria bacterium]